MNDCQLSSFPRLIRWWLISASPDGNRSIDSANNVSLPLLPEFTSIDIKDLLGYCPTYLLCFSNPIDGTELSAELEIASHRSERMTDDDKSWPRSTAGPGWHVRKNPDMKTQNMT